MKKPSERRRATPPVKVLFVTGLAIMLLGLGPGEAFARKKQTKKGPSKVARNSTPPASLPAPAADKKAPADDGTWTSNDAPRRPGSGTGERDQGDYRPQHIHP